MTGNFLAGIWGIGGRSFYHLQGETKISDGIYFEWFDLIGPGVELKLLNSSICF